MSIRKYDRIGFIASFALLLLTSLPVLAIQDESAEDKQYREDYDRVQKIVAIADSVRRADQLFAFLRDRPNSKMTEYAQGNYFQVLEGLLKGENFSALMTLSDRYIKLRPKVGETYYFYGAALRNAKRYADAMDALAKCYVIRTPASRKAKDFLEFVYKSQHSGSLVGLETIIKKAQVEIAK